MLKHYSPFIKMTITDQIENNGSISTQMKNIQSLGIEIFRVSRKVITDLWIILSHKRA